MELLVIWNAMTMILRQSYCDALGHKRKGQGQAMEKGI